MTCSSNNFTLLVWLASVQTTSLEKRFCWSGWQGNSSHKPIMKYLIAGVGIVVLIVVVALFVSVPVWLLWNWLMPAIFGLNTITWLQALGLSILSSLLLKSSSSSSS